MENIYYLGLDVGTNSIGWAVTDKDYNICKFKGKTMWGIRLFEDANTAADRRIQRNNRRRLDRKKERIDLLQEIFAPEVQKIDPEFFIRLNESRLQGIDKTVEFNYPLFDRKEFNDIDFHKTYPTIYHLRKNLIENGNNKDIRFLYLALHHIIKNRGHFLIEGNLDAVNDFNLSFDAAFNLLRTEVDLKYTISDKNKAEIEKVLRDRNITNSEKQSKILPLFEVEASDLDKKGLKENKDKLTNFVKLICGLKGDLTKIFDIEQGVIEKTSFSFTEAAYEDTISLEIEDKIPEIFLIVQHMKVIFDWSVLVDLLKDEKYFSFAKVKEYEEHKINLKKLREIVLKYFDKKTYNRMFNSKESKTGYAGYIGYVKKNGKKYTVKKSTEDEFYSQLKEVFADLKVNPEDQQTLDEIKKKIEMKNLLPVQRSKDNGVVPKQIHELELNRILDNSVSNFPFLLQKDADGISNLEKIKILFNHKIPYYVGPISSRHRGKQYNIWSVRYENQNGKIYPWNIEKIIDFEKSNEEFINRMTNKDTYLIGEDVLPANSLTYSKYTVLNELNNVRVRGNKLTVETKQKIFDELFKNKYKVTGKTLLNYLKIDLPDLMPEDLSGFDGDFKSSLKSYIDFNKNVFVNKMDQEEYQKIAEDIIRWITIYGNDKKMLGNVIKKNYGDKIDNHQLKSILSLSYSGWGRFSNKLLCGIEGVNTETGEVGSLLEFLWNTNDNLMQLLSGKYTFTENINDINKQILGNIDSITFENVVQDLYTSPANKRAIWQSILIAQEIKKIMGSEPKKIFVEMARGAEKKDKNGKGARKDSRKENLLKLYKNCSADCRELLDEIEKRDERDFNSLKLYLYYTQLGRCMYTGEPINLDQLMRGNSKWDRDHIYPQSKLKDDSLDNLVLVNKEANAKKSNGLISLEIQNNRKAFWKDLLDKELISQTKYDRLTRKGDFTSDELSGFIGRQLVETRQSTKLIANTLEKLYVNSTVIYVKSSLVSDFRKKQLKYLKSRLVNDFHHAKDAYLNIVVGNVYNTKFTSNPITWLKKKENENYSLNRVFDFDVIRNNETAWEAPKKSADGKYSGGTLERVRNIVKKDDVLYTEYTYCNKGQLFNLTIQKKDKENKGLIPIKKNLDPKRYGGYISPSTSYFAMIEFDGKKNTRSRQIVGVPYYISLLSASDDSQIIRYFEEIKGFKNVKIIYKPIKKNALIVVDGYPLRIRGENDSDIMLKNNVQLKCDEKYYEIIRKIEKFLGKDNEFEVNEIYDSFNDEDLNNVYMYLINKLSTIYSKRPANKVQFLAENEETFKNIKSLRQKAKLISNILTFTRCDIETKTSLKIIGGKENCGSITINKNTLGSRNLEIINQSVTGLFENRIRL